MCPTLTVGNFFRRVRSIFCSFVQQRQTSTTSSLNNSNLKSASKRNEETKQMPEPRNHTKDPPIAPLFFGTMRLFLKLFGLHQRVHTSFVSIFCNTMDVKTTQRVPPFTFFGTVTLQKSHFKIFFWKFFQVPKGLLFIFFSYFAASWSFTKPEGSPLLQF